MQGYVMATGALFGLLTMEPLWAGALLRVSRRRAP